MTYHDLTDESKVDRMSMRDFNLRVRRMLEAQGFYFQQSKTQEIPEPDPHSLSYTPITKMKLVDILADLKKRQQEENKP